MHLFTDIFKRIMLPLRIHRPRLNVRWHVRLWIHTLFLRLGYHFIPVHYYSPVPNILDLAKTRDIWAKKSELPGLAVNLDDQASRLKAVCIPYRSEYAGNTHFLEATSNQLGQGYGYIEAQALHALIRHYKPRRIMEVGSGVSTYCMLKAAELNRRDSGHDCEIVCIEPYPSPGLKALSPIELIPEQVQTVPFTRFSELKENDLLFIDSSHTVKPGGDVNFLILEVLPRLAQGVVVHFHDIYLPYDYQPDVFKTYWHWAETSLLRAFLAFNNKVRILFCLSHLHCERRDVLREVFPEYNPLTDVNGLCLELNGPWSRAPGHWPSSTYIQIQ